jgi:hypothetical protein
LLSLAAGDAAYAHDKPNIVLLFADNLGYGELDAYGGGIVCGAPTSRLDALARVIWQERQYDAPQWLPDLRLIDLYDNPQARPEKTPGESAVVTDRWIAHAMFGDRAKFPQSPKKYPPIPTRRRPSPNHEANGSISAPSEARGVAALPVQRARSNSRAECDAPSSFVRPNA